MSRPALVALSTIDHLPKFEEGGEEHDDANRAALMTINECVSTCFAKYACTQAGCALLMKNGALMPMVRMVDSKQTRVKCPSALMLCNVLGNPTCATSAIECGAIGVVVRMSQYVYARAEEEELDAAVRAQAEHERREAEEKALLKKGGGLRKPKESAAEAKDESKDEVEAKAKPDSGAATRGRGRGRGRGPAWQSGREGRGEGRGG